MDSALKVHQLDRAARLRAEERANTVTHGLGFLISVVGFVLLLAVAMRRGNTWQVIGCTVYGTTLVAVYGASTLSHIFHQTRYRRMFRILDQAFIFLLIAGTFTPPALSYLRGGPWWILFGAMWSVALFGFLSKTLFRHQIEAVTTTVHVLMGWMPLVALKPMLGLVPGGLFAWMLAGGLFYTAGTFFLKHDNKLPYFHAVWHVFVIAGSLCHYLGILEYCTAG